MPYSRGEFCCRYMLSLMMSSAGTPIITRNTTASVDTIKLTINLRYWVTYYTASVPAVA
eukprot:CAMPEP_0201741140 /NCGR_PEP_ID=MMETSP0593-20130828/46661_1 /ASSEMBLY_ACC=CAM_ASM_000672 /TAXON_ID=267983 /ORGANISM="Skeletonema japonicum, Strain CCMP2506" /LENGTH=58 /DNA_ID=CAMNT_0048235467 /DNA_START=678 /DNA_END=854 /DNA_ORIENTATION=-